MLTLDGIINEIVDIASRQCWRYKELTVKTKENDISLLGHFKRTKLSLSLLLLGLSGRHAMFEPRLSNWLLLILLVFFFPPFYWNSFFFFNSFNIIYDYGKIFIISCARAFCISLSLFYCRSIIDLSGESFEDTHWVSRIQCHCMPRTGWSIEAVRGHSRIRCEGQHVRERQREREQGRYVTRIEGRKIPLQDRSISSTIRGLVVLLVSLIAARVYWGGSLSGEIYLRSTLICLVGQRYWWSKPPWLICLRITAEHLSKANCHTMSTQSFELFT